MDSSRWSSLLHSLLQQVPKIHGRYHCLEVHLSLLGIDHTQAFRQQIGCAVYEHIPTNQDKLQTQLCCYSQRLSSSREHFKTAEGLVFVEEDRRHWVTVSFLSRLLSQVQAMCIQYVLQITVKLSFHHLWKNQLMICFFSTVTHIWSWQIISSEL